MTLDHYMKQKGLSDEQFGKLIEKDRTLIGRYRRNQVTPPVEVIAKIEEVTGRRVQFRDWLGEGS